MNKKLVNTTNKTIIIQTTKIKSGVDFIVVKLTIQRECNCGKEKFGWGGHALSCPIDN